VQAGQLIAYSGNEGRSTGNKNRGTQVGCKFNNTKQ